MEEIIVYSNRGKDTITLKEDAIIVYLMKTERVIPISQIISFEVKDPKSPMRPGQITIRLGGSSDTAIGLTSFMSVGRSNNIEFFHGYDSLAAAHKIQDYIASYKPKGAADTVAYSVADEIRKFKELLDDGAITQDEYDKAKKKLLGF